MDSGEMLKQLLDKFTNESAVIEEELKLVQEQIGELESKLDQCHQKQQTIGTDRNKVMNMLERYVHGNSNSLVAQARPALSDKQTSVKVSALATKQPETVKPQGISNRIRNQKVAPEPQLIAEPQTTPEQQPAPESQAVAETLPPDNSQSVINEPNDNNTEVPAESDNETVKSINDALRSLFK